MQPRIISSGCSSLCVSRYSYANPIATPIRSCPVKLSMVNACRPAGPKFAFKTIAAGAKIKKSSFSRGLSADAPS